ncbi:MAG TPA: phosphatidate cytidylyltransferase [Bacteroidia bacterium]|jgi:phosphatidate cytidylyltransferase|nr:phosphatidate cytidylyltransferase [Bacteroidia bacterium]
MDKNLIQRSITGTLFVIIVVSCIWFSPWSMFALFLLITILGLHEFYKLAEKTGAHPQSNFAIAAGSVTVLLVFLEKAFPFSYSIYWALLIVFLFLPFFIELYRKKENPFSNIAWTLLGYIYIVVPICMLVGTFTPHYLIESLLIKDDEFIMPSYSMIKYDHASLLTFFILIWTSDTMAYVCGRLFGKHKLFERVSPKKTWEGFIGGLLFTIITGGMIANWIIGNPHNYHHEILWICMAVTISITGVLGDLSESLFKRSINIKDSGNILPGHGGILDRFDAMLLATPFAMAVYWVCDATMGTASYFLHTTTH